MALIEFKDYPNTDTPIDAGNLNNNFSELDEKIGDLSELDTTDKANVVSAINEANEKTTKHVVTANYANTRNLSASTQTKVALMNAITVGGKLTFDSTNKRIVVGAGVSKVLVSSVYILGWDSPVANYVINIYKNGVGVLGSWAGGYKQNSGLEDGTSIAPFLVSVNENDYFELYEFSSAAITNKGLLAKLTVEVVE